MVYGDPVYLSKREWFAGLAMSAIRAEAGHDWNILTPPELARMSIADADALIAELEKDNKPPQDVTIEPQADMSKKLENVDTLKECVDTKYTSKAEQCVEWPGEVESLDAGERLCNPHDSCAEIWFKCERWLKANTKLRSVDEVRTEYESPRYKGKPLTHEDFKNSLEYQRDLAEMQHEELQKQIARVKVLREALGEIERRANEYVETTPEYTYGIIAREALKNAGDVG